MTIDITQQAFPTHWQDDRTGMTLRDYFAGQALAGMLAQDVRNPLGVSQEAYEVADEMLKVRAATSEAHHG